MLPAPDQEGGTHVDQVEGVVSITNALGNAPGNGHGGESPVVANLTIQKTKKKERSILVQVQTRSQRHNSKQLFYFRQGEQGADAPDEQETRSDLHGSGADR